MNDGRILAGRWVIASIAAVALVGEARAKDHVDYAPAPEWVIAAPSTARESAPASGELEVSYQDFQIYADREADYLYQAYRLSLLGPQALAAGNLSLSWNPDDGGITVHFVRIWRRGELIDVLKATRFNVLRREAALEQAKLDGLLTAVMQVPDLQIGDDLEFAATIENRNATLKNLSFGFVQLPLVGSNGEFRARLSWAPDSAPIIHTTSDLGSVTTRDGQSFLVTLRQPTRVVQPEQAPARYLTARLIEYSDFGDWQELSRTMAPLFSKASQLDRDSALLEKIGQIKANSTDPSVRLRAALRLVQDEIRYVYVGLNGGNLRPASADETWQRRFGDCKAKTVLLLALLDKLGIEARPVLVNSLGGDGIDRFLPTPGVFDHVLVQAILDGKTYWLDGTRVGDSRLLTTPAAPYRWVLPLSARGEALAQVPLLPPSLPLTIDVTDIDSTAGVDKPARVRFQRIIRGDPGLAIRAQLSVVSVGEAVALIKADYRRNNSWFRPEEANWSYDDKSAAAILNVSGSGDLEWEPRNQKTSGSKAVGWTIFGYGFYPPDRRERLPGQDGSLPWAIEFPVFKCIVTTLRLPPAAAGLKWDHSADSMAQTVAGTTYWRMAELKNGIMRMVRSTRNEAPEISAAMAASANAEISAFDNNTASVFMTRKVDPAPMRQVPIDSIAEVPTADAVDWTGEDTLCTPRDQ